MHTSELEGQRSPGVQRPCETGISFALQSTVDPPPLLPLRLLVCLSLSRGSTALSRPHKAGHSRY